MDQSRGIVLMIWGNRAYGYAAHNFTLTIKQTSPLLPVHLIADQEALKGCPQPALFDGITQMRRTPEDPALCKMQIFDKLPYDHNLFLDVDAIALNDLNAVIDQCITDGRSYRCMVHAWYDKNSPEKLPMMVWAKKSTIWNHYGFKEEKLPATQSSLQYIKRDQFCEDLFFNIQRNYKNRIPTAELLNRWGGGQPDELYLNVTLAQMGYDPSLDGVIYFGDDISLRFHQVKEKYSLFSMFGTAQNIKPQFIKAYNAEVATAANQIGLKPIDWQHIAGHKLANKRSSPMAKNDGWGRSAFAKRFFPEARKPQEPVKGTVHLYISNLYETISEERKAELMECLRKNAENPIITKIFNWGNLPYQHPKVINVAADKRPTYQDFIDAANKEGADYTIISNSDLYFDDSLNWIDKVNMASVMIALCRYDIQKDGGARLEAFSWSQGTWIFKGHIGLTGIDYALGLPGCDNAIAYDADQQGYHVANPAKDIKCYHLHKTAERNYTQKDRLQRSYLPVLITSILELQKHKKVLIKQRGAVGDILIVLPIAETLAKQGFEVEWLCPKQYHPMFEYVDYAKPVTEETGNYEKVVDLSFGQDRNSRVHRIWERRRRNLDSFVTLKFELAGITMAKHRKLNYKRNEKKELDLLERVTAGISGPFALVHDRSTYGGIADIDTDLPIIYFKPLAGFEIFDWRKVIEQAAEIHCIDSSLINFVDCLDNTGKLFYYQLNERARMANQTKLLRPWKLIREGQKQVA